MREGLPQFLFLFLLPILASYWSKLSCFNHARHHTVYTHPSFVSLDRHLQVVDSSTPISERGMARSLGEEAQVRGVAESRHRELRVTEDIRVFLHPGGHHLGLGVWQEVEEIECDNQSISFSIMLTHVWHFKQPSLSLCQIRHTLLRSVVLEF